jgi:prolyl-tRNA synthetase
MRGRETKLMTRAMIKSRLQVFTALMLWAYAVVRKVEAIVREEMNRAGAVD